MEMSWFALLPTIVIALIIAGLALFGSREPARTDARTGGHDAAPIDSLPTFGRGVRDIGSWLRDARKPVWPIDFKDLNARLRRGFKLAGLMTMVAVAIVAARQPSQDLALLLFLGTLLAGAVLVAFACIASIIHSLILQILPYRGLIVSTTLGWAIGFAVAFLSRTNADFPSRALVWSGVIYGFLMGIIDSSIVPERARKPGMRPPRRATT